MSISQEQQLKNITNDTAAILEQLAKLSVNVTAIFARLDALDKAFVSNNISTKRSIKVVAADKGVDDAESESSATLKSLSQDDKIINSLTFFKKLIMYKNYNNMRNNYVEAINLVKSTIKKPENSESYWISIGNSIWKTFDKNQKKEILEEYKKWKALYTAEGQSQLDADENNLSDE